MLAARTGLSPVMVGRAAKLARLRELAGATGDPAVALLSGEAGIGKTRLVAELVATLDPALGVLAGQGSLKFVGVGAIILYASPASEGMNPLPNNGFMDGRTGQGIRRLGLRAMVRAGIYIRISKAKRELLDAQRQQPPCEAFCRAQGWQVVDVYLDDDRSAWRREVRRDDFERMLADVRAGRIDAIVSWQMDRLLRRVEDADAIIAIAKQYGVIIANVDGALDLGTAAGRKKLHDLAVAAEYAGDLSSERIKLKHAELAAEGKFSGGTRPFGYELEEYVYTDHAGKHLKHRMVINPAEAKAIKDAAEAVIDGRATVTAIVKEWAAGNVRSTRNRLFRYGGVRELLLSPRIAGMRHADGKPVKADWQPIITREQHEELTRILGLPRQRGSNRGTTRSYLLTGFVFCGACGTRLRSHRSKATREAKPRPRYACDRRDGGCGGIKRLASVVDDHVVLHLLRELPGRLLDSAARASQEGETLGRLLTARQTQEDRLEGLADYLADGTLTRDEYLRQKRRLRARWDELDGRIAEVRARNPRRRLRGATLEELRQEWEQLDLEDKRAVLADHVERVVVKRVGPGRRPFDPDSIQIIWRKADVREAQETSQVVGKLGPSHLGTALAHSPNERE